MDFKNGVTNMQAAGYNSVSTITVRISTCLTYVDQNSFHLICLIKSLIGGGNSYHDQLNKQNVNRILLFLKLQKKEICKIDQYIPT